MDVGENIDTEPFWVSRLFIAETTCDDELKSEKEAGNAVRQTTQTEMTTRNNRETFLASMNHSYVEALESR
jgi:hypothetical protein